MDIKAYLRDLDREEEELRREIAQRQLRIAQLHDTRVLMMHREEERAVRLGGHSPFGAVAGGEIVLRDPALMLAASEAGRLSRVAKTGSSTVPTKALTSAAGENSYPSGSQPIRDGATITHRALAIMAEASEPMAAGEIADLMPDVKRRRIHNACSNLKSRGSAGWDRDHRYSITAKGRRELAGKVVRAYPTPRGEQGKVAPLIEAAFMAAPDAVLSPYEACAAVFGERADRPGGASKKERDRVYAHLHKLKNEGTLVRLDDGRYRWAGARRQEAAA